MDKLEARKYIPLVNTPEFVNLFQGLIDEVISQTTKGFEQVDDEVVLRQMQGKIQSLKKIRDIRETINQEAK